MNISKRLEAVETALAKQRGDYGIKLAFLEEGETEEQARGRARLIDWKGELIFVSRIDANL